VHLKGALHVHTTCSDGELSVQESIRAYGDLGYDFVALTDHDYLLRPGCYDVVNDLDTEMIVFKGVELTVFEKGYCHVNRIKGEEETLHIFNHPAQLDLPFDKVVERIESVAKKLPLDAVEVTSNGFRTPEYDCPEISYPGVATDDAHHRHMVGRAWIEMDCLRNMDSIIKAVKRGDFWNCYNN